MCSGGCSGWGRGAALGRMLRLWRETSELWRDRGAGRSAIRWWVMKMSSCGVNEEERRGRRGRRRGG